MKKMNLRVLKTFKFSLLIILGLIFGCQGTTNKGSLYERILEYSDEILVVNTHEHQHEPVEYEIDTLNFFHLLHGAYLMQDLISAGGSRLEIKEIDTIPLDEQWEMFGAQLDFSRSTSYYAHFVKGFQKLYDFDELYFTGSNIKVLSAQVVSNYSDFDNWYGEAFKKAGFEIMFNDQYWKPFNVDIDTRYFALVFHVNAIVYDIAKRPEPGGDVVWTYDYAEKDGFEINRLSDYLDYCDFLFQLNLERNAVCIKNSMAYGRSLDYDEVSLEEAERLYEIPPSQLTDQEKKKLEDFMFHWIIKKSIEHDLPIQIHTGYLAGSGNTLDNGQPIKLNKLFIKYGDARFVLFHGGYPWTSEFVALGKMFPNVYLDLVWLPQISREKAVLTLDEMLDCVPYNKIFWGGDCAFIEESTGSLEFAKSVVAETLAKRIERGLLTEDVAYDMVKRIFRANAIEVFNLNEKLGISTD
jgi:hypothetical protein